MTFSVELYTPPSSEFASKLLFNIYAILDEYFAKKKILHEIRCCSSYLLDKRVLNLKEYFEKSNKSLDELLQTVSKSYLIEFSWLNISPNRKMFKRVGQKYELTPFSLCNCFNCKSMLRCLWIWINKKKTIFYVIILYLVVILSVAFSPSENI